MTTPTKQPVGRPVTKTRPPKPEFIAMDITPGDSIGEACRKAVKMAQQKHTVIRFNYQGMDLEATEDTDEWDLANKWFRAQKGKAS